MELSTGWTITSEIDNGVQYITSTCDKSPGLSYDGLYIYGQPGIINNITNNTKVAIGFSPYNHSGIILGAVNVIPDNNTTLSNTNVDYSIQPGETVLSETANYNYTLQAKLDRLQAVFKNKQATIATQMLNGEAIVQILRDILDEFSNNLKSYINSTVNSAILNHGHAAGSYLDSLGKAVTGVAGQATMMNSAPNPTPLTINDYAPASNISGRDTDYLSNAKCYVNDSGDVLK